MIFINYLTYFVFRIFTPCVHNYVFFIIIYNIFLFYLGWFGNQSVGTTRRWCILGETSEPSRRRLFRRQAQRTKGLPAASIHAEVY